MQKTIIDSKGKVTVVDLTPEEIAERIANAPPIVVAVPAKCTRRQGRLALLAVGKLAAAESFIESISDPVAKMQARIEYEADTWERSNAFLQQAWGALGGTSEEFDGLFSLAVTL